jgi:uncharacterized membrane protein YeaQ/YmgE (transglycosylase-associated protein family)
MNTTALLFQLIGGGVAGYAAGHFVRDITLGGPVANAAVGALGGGIVGQVLFAILGLSGTVQVASALITGAIGGGLGTLLVGFVKSKISA